MAHAFLKYINPCCTSTILGMCSQDLLRAVSWAMVTHIWLRINLLKYHIEFDSFHQQSRHPPSTSHTANSPLSQTTDGPYLPFQPHPSYASGRHCIQKACTLLYIRSLDIFHIARLNWLSFWRNAHFLDLWPSYVPNRFQDIIKFFPLYKAFSFSC